MGSTINKRSVVREIYTMNDIESFIIDKFDMYLNYLLFPFLFLT